MEENKTYLHTTKAELIHKTSELEKKSKEDGIEKRVGGALIFRNNKILLLKRNTDEFMPNLLELPSGNIEKEEEILEGLSREVLEETGMKVSKFTFFVDTFDYKSQSGKKARQFNFIVEVPEDAEVTICKEEHQSFCWVDPKQDEELEKLGVSKHTRETIQIANTIIENSK